MKSKVKTLDEIKSVRLQPCEAGFHRESDFIHQRWISPVEDGFDCVILLTEYHAIPSGFSGDAMGFELPEPKRLSKMAKNAKKSVLSVGDKSYIELTLIN